MRVNTSDTESQSNRDTQTEIDRERQRKTQTETDRHTFSDIGRASSDVALDEQQLLVVGGDAQDLVDLLQAVGQLADVVLAQAEQHVCVRHVPAD